MRILTGIMILFLFVSCQGKRESLKQGVWRGVIRLQGQELPFNFSVRQDTAGRYTVFIKNAAENLRLDEIHIKDDSLILPLHIFDSELRVAVEGDSLKGYYIRNYEKDYRLPFVAAYNQDYRFIPPDNNMVSPAIFNGKYMVTFTNDSDTTPAVGIFQHTAGNIIVGTFLTPTGDYRYLEGNLIDGKMHLSAFDGNHAYIFTAQKTNDSTLTGEYWSGKSWHQAWTGIRNDKATLEGEESLTYLKEGYDRIDFTFPDVNGKKISLTDAKYKDKVVVLQLLGTWCPNCMDETRFLAPWYAANKERGVEVIGLAYEAKDDFNYASSRVKKMTERMQVRYDVLIGGVKDKKEAAKTLPMLNKVVAFPTTIFIGRDGKVKKIHTGFSGPGTGIYYEQFVQHFNETVNELLGEKLP